MSPGPPPVGPAPLRVVAPHATRTGSTRVLIDLLTAASAALGARLAVEVRSGGPLLDELRALGPPLGPGETPSAVLLNTSLVADEVLRAEAPACVYVHEAREVLAALPGPATDGLRAADLVLCVSDRVRADVVDLGVAPDRATVLPPLVVPRPPAGGDEIATVRRTLGLRREDRLVVGCGEADWRKGTDLFVEVARQLRDDQAVHLAWVGRRLRSVARVLDHDVDRIGMSDRVTWTGDVPDAHPYLAAADVLVMCSRDDPRPLVPLEAAGVGTPTVAFAVGGLAELAEAGAARAVPFPDAAALADEVRRHLSDPTIGERSVAAARRRADATQGPEVVVGELLIRLAGLVDDVEAPGPGRA